ncbi:hypothetical protein OHA25_14640 [Nonomuraea sp. NBC_00507]|uniref:hypothetical protein n=1 Tax=Nonomuraea sp. NBC_00507 TaxID=2976002 RepID=UPI002E1800F0
MTNSAPPCRLHVLVATAAPVALIMRRGPAGWWHLRQWDNKRGWRPLEGAAKRMPPGLREAVLIGRVQPGGDRALVLAHTGTDFQRHGIEGVQVDYLREEDDGSLTPLPEAAAWADWDSKGRLLMAARAGVVKPLQRAHEGHDSQVEVGVGTVALVTGDI